MNDRLTYCDSGDQRADKVQQERLLAALSAWDRALRREECAAWTIRGKHGSICTWGDAAHAAWAVYVEPVSMVDPEGSPRAWTAAKRKLAFMTVPQDGDSEGMFRLDRLPTAEEAGLIRDVLGIRRRVELSPEEVERRQMLVAKARQAIGASTALIADGFQASPVPLSPWGHPGVPSRARRAYSALYPSSGAGLTRNRGYG